MDYLINGCIKLNTIKTDLQNVLSTILTSLFFFMKIIGDMPDQEVGSLLLVC